MGGRCRQIACFFRKAAAKGDAQQKELTPRLQAVTWNTPRRPAGATSCKKSLRRARKLSQVRKADVSALHAKIGKNHGPYAANRLLALLSARVVTNYRDFLLLGRDAQGNPLPISFYGGVHRLKLAPFLSCGPPECVCIVANGSSLADNPLSCSGTGRLAPLRRGQPRQPVRPSFQDNG